MITTIRGKRRVEDLRPDDKILTRDNGFQPLAWVGARRFDPRLETPIILRCGHYGDFDVEEDLLLDARHRVLRGRWSGSSDKPEETLVEAVKIAVASKVPTLRAFPNLYVHLLFAQHQVINANGVWVESLMPTEEMISGLSDRNRRSMLGQLPDLAGKGVNTYSPARLLAA